MINWKQLYYRLLLEGEVSIDTTGEYHHSVPRHSDGVDSRLVKLSHRNHTLAHYIRFRWLGHPGDKVAYQMMSGQLLNPMHDPFIRAKVITYNQSAAGRQKSSDTFTRYYANPENLARHSEQRKQFIANMPDKRVMTAHMNDPQKISDYIEKRVATYKQTAKNNPERFANNSKLRGDILRRNNLLRSDIELADIYGRGTGANNPKWRGYVIVELGNNKQIFDSFQDAYQKIGLTYGLANKYKNTNIPVKAGRLKGSIISLTKFIS